MAKIGRAVAVTCLLLDGVAHAQTAAAGTFVYRGAGCTGQAAVGSFASLIGRAPDGVNEFADNSSWQAMLDSTGWAMRCWNNTPHGLSQAVPMLVQGANLADGAKGLYSQHYVQLGRMLVAGGHADAYLRIGWEFNGSWYSWNAAQDPAAFKLYFRRIVYALRSVPGQHFKIVWNPALGQQQIAPDQAYPGNGYVDVIALDVYDQSWRPQDSDAATRWNGLLSQPYGLNWLVNFARINKKPIALPEWGTGTRPDGHGYADDAYFIDAMAAFIAEHNVAYHGYWDYAAPDFDGEISTGAQPEAAAAFARAF